MTMSWSVRNSVNDRYGLGIRHDKSDNLEFIGHSGSFPGFSSETRHWKGTDYIFSFLLNTHELIASSVVSSIAQLFRLVETTFDPTDDVSISPPLMNMWGASLWIVGNERAAMLDVETWTPCNGVTLFEKQGDKYISVQASGYRCVGEPAIFERDGGGKIISVLHGMFSAFSEECFLNKSRKTLLPCTQFPSLG